MQFFATKFVKCVNAWLIRRHCLNFRGVCSADMPVSGVFTITTLHAVTDSFRFILEEENQELRGSLQACQSGSEPLWKEMFMQSQVCALQAWLAQVPGHQAGWRESC